MDEPRRPAPDPELFDAPWPEREALYAAVSGGVSADQLEPLTALLLLDERAPVAQLLPVLRAALDPLLEVAIAPYREVFDGLEAGRKPPLEQLAQAEQVVERFVTKSSGDPFEAVRGLPLPEAVAALSDAALRSAVCFDRRPMLRLVQQEDPLAAALLDGIFQTARHLRNRRGEPIGATPLRNVPYQRLILHRARTDSLWRPLRARCDSELALLACRLEALAGEGSLSELDALRLPQEMESNWRFSPERSPLLQKPHAATALRWLLQHPDRELQSYERGRLLERLVLCAVEVCRTARPRRPLDPTELTLLAALRADPGDRSTWQVYADWHEQRGNARPLAALLGRLHLCSQPGAGTGALVRPVYAALAAARLGDQTAVPVLIEAFQRYPSLRHATVEALWELGPLPAEISLPDELDVPEGEALALRAMLDPDDPWPLQEILQRLPIWLNAHDDYWLRTRTARIAAFTLFRRAGRHPSLVGRVEALAASLEREHPELLEQDLRWWRHNGSSR